jgi:hypothetical protein
MSIPDEVRREHSHRFREQPDSSQLANLGASLIAHSFAVCFRCDSIEAETDPELC